MPRRACHDHGGLRAPEDAGRPAEFFAYPVELPPHDGVLIASGELAGRVLPPDTGAWLRTRSPGPADA